MQECEWLPTVKTGLHSHRVTSPGSNLLDTMFKILNLTSGENVRMWPSNPRGPSSKDSLATRWKWEKGQRRRIYPSRQIPNYHAMFNYKVLWDTFLKLKLSNECIHLKNHLTAINLCSKHWDHKVSKRSGDRWSVRAADRLRQEQNTSVSQHLASSYCVPSFAGTVVARTEESLLKEYLFPWVVEDCGEDWEVP